MPKNDTEIKDIASNVSRTNDLEDRDKLALALELIVQSGIRVRPEVTSYLRDELETSYVRD